MKRRAFCVSHPKSSGGVSRTLAAKLGHRGRRTRSSLRWLRGWLWLPGNERVCELCSLSLSGQSRSGFGHVRHDKSRALTKIGVIALGSSANRANKRHVLTLPQSAQIKTRAEASLSALVPLSSTTL